MGEARRVYQARDGVRKSIISDAIAGTVTFHTEQDVEPILDSIARDREIMTNRGENKLAARLPRIVWEELKRTGIADDEDAFKRWLNGPEAAPWRVWQGQL